MNKDNYQYHLIVNPKAASGGGRSRLVRAVEILNAHHADYKVHIPASSEKMQALTASLTEKGRKSHLIVFGGDGTLNTVFQAVKDMEHTRFSCIRMGSGNDFAANMGLPSSVDQAMTHLLEDPEEILLDYGELWARKDPADPGVRRRFLISCGIGYDADICEEVSRSSLKKTLNFFGLGKLVYMAIGIKQMFTREFTPAVIRLDDRAVYRLRGMNFCVGMMHPREGGGVPFCPEAVPTDGLMDVCMADAMSSLKMLAGLPMIYLGLHHLVPELKLLRGSRIRITTKRPQWYHMDGETSVKIRRLELYACSGLHFVR